jgi:hypothetical protein
VWIEFGLAIHIVNIMQGFLNNTCLQLEIVGTYRLILKTIKSLIVNGSPTSDPACIGEHVVNYYESLFSEPLSWRPRLDNLESDRLNGEEASSLEDLFEEREVIKGMDRDKVPAQMIFLWLFFRIVGRWLRETS